VLAGVAVGTTVAVEALALVARRLAGPAAAPRAVELHGTFTHHVLHHHVVHHVVHVVDLPSRRSPTAS
jgi:hypothetical protein